MRLRTHLKDAGVWFSPMAFSNGKQRAQRKYRYSFIWSRVDHLPSRDSMKPGRLRLAKNSSHARLSQLDQMNSFARFMTECQSYCRKGPKICGSIRPLRTTR